MDPIVSQVSLDDVEHAANRRALEPILEEYRERTRRAMAGGGAETVAKHKARGKMLARERIEGLLDPGSPFLEFSTLAAEEMYGGDAPGAGIFLCGTGSPELGDS